MHRCGRVVGLFRVSDHAMSVPYLPLLSVWLHAVFQYNVLLVFPLTHLSILGHQTIVIIAKVVISL